MPKALCTWLLGRPRGRHGRGGKYYLGEKGVRSYHHTAPSNMTYALRESLVMVLEEGLEQRFARHEQMHLRLRKGLEAMGLTYVPKNSLYTLNCVRIPAGADDAGVRRRLLQEYGIEISGGLGPLAGKTWRIGLMGNGAIRSGERRGGKKGRSPGAPHP